MPQHTVNGAARTVNPAKPRTKWTDELIEVELRRVAGALGSFPTANELRSVGHNDIACIVSKRGGFALWAERLGLSRKHSDSDTGWAGEAAFASIAVAAGHVAERTHRIKAPFDILIDGVLRVDVKTASFATYGQSSGWFYRIGKMPQADIIVLYQADTGDYFALPWLVCPHTNVTICRGGGKYEWFKNNAPLIRQMVATRRIELELMKRTA